MLAAKVILMPPDEMARELQKSGGERISVIEKSERDDAERSFERVRRERDDLQDQTQEWHAIHEAARVDCARMHREAEELRDEVIVAQDETKDASGLAA